MQKKMKLLALFMSVLFAVGMLSACAGGGENNGSGDNGNTQEEPYRPIELESNGIPLTSYKIVVPEGTESSVLYAAGRLNHYFQEATDSTLEIIRDSQAETEYEIILGDTARGEDAGIDFAALGTESYVVKNVGNDLVIAGGDRGVIYGVYAYLEALGYRFYTAEAENIPVAQEVFVAKEVSLEWSPVFEYRESMFCSTWDADFAVSQGINSNFMRSALRNDSKYGGSTGYIGGDSFLVHTAKYLLPDSLYTEHPEYFSLVDGKRTKNQPCFTSEGAYQEIYKNVVARIKQDPSSNIISITENDNGDFCECENCTDPALGGLSGTYFRFINRIAKQLKEDGYDDIIVDALSYGMAVDVPEGIELEDNVVVRLCTKFCFFHTDPDECDKLKKQIDRLADWSEFCDRLYIWAYPIEWPNLFAALPNYEELRYQVRTFAEYGVKGVYMECYSKEDPEFADLKAYLVSKLLMNPYMTEAEYRYHMEDFLQGYYGDAGEYVKEYIDYTRDWIMDDIAEGSEIGHEETVTVENNFIFPYDDSTHEYDLSRIDEVNEIWDTAESYAVGEQLDRVKQSRLHWTYIELYNTMDDRYEYGDTATRDELEARNRELYENIFKYGTLYRFDNARPFSSGIQDFTYSPKSGRW